MRLLRFKALMRDAARLTRNEILALDSSNPDASVTT